MKRNSSTLFLDSPGAITPIPWIDGSPDFSAFSEPTLSVLITSWKEFLISGEELEIILDSEPTEIKEADWNGLQNRLLSGDLYFLYSRARMACFVPTNATSEAIAYANNISTALSLITDGILTVKIEDAVADAIAILIQVGYVFTEEEKSTWNKAIGELGFSDLLLI